jgi:hypothetical protein
MESHDVPGSFAALRVVRAGPIHLDETPEVVFPLFTPEGERLWVPGWNPIHRYPADGRLEAGAVFVTRAPGEPETIWTVVRYDPAALSVAYDRITPGIRAVLVEVRCEADADDSTRAHVTYTATALSEDGNAIVAAFTEAHYATMLDEWETAINRHLAADAPNRG